MSGQLPNPNRPLLAFDVDFTAGPPSLTGTSRHSIDNPRNRMSVRQVSITRGRQYELDQVQSGTATLSIDDPLECLNPANASSPFATSGNSILPYRCLSISAYWPLTGNVINATVNAAFDPSFETTTGGVVAGGGTTLVRSTAQAFVGTHSLLVTQGAATSGSWPSIVVPGVPGITMTVSIYAYLTGGARMQIRCPDGTNSAILTTQTTWTRITVTYTQVDAQDSIVFAGTNVSTPTFYLDAFQCEWAAAATAFSTSGPTRYQQYNGYVERWPTAYEDFGNKSVHSLTAVDALAILSRTVIAQSYQATVASDAPLMLLPFNDEGPPGLFVIGGRSLAGYLSPSSSGTFGWRGDTFPDGTSVLSITQQNPNNPPAGGGSNQDTTWDNLPNWGAGLMAMSVEGSSMEIWAKFTAGTVVFGQMAQINLGPSLAPTDTNLRVVSVQGRMTFRIVDSVAGWTMSKSTLDVNAAAYDGFPDDQWHYYAITLTKTGGGTRVITLTIDNYEQTFTPSAYAFSSWGINDIHADCETGYGDPQSKISLAWMAAYSSDITSTRRLAHYNRGVGYSNELSGARVSRLLSQYWMGSTSVAPGYAQLSPDLSYNTRTTLDVLQEIQDTEHGLCYVNRSGVLTYEDRTSRYSSQVALWTLGENAGTGEYPYVLYEGEYDPTYTFSQANLSRPADNAFPPQINAATQAVVGQRILSQTLQVNTTFDLQQAATFYLKRYGTTTPRITRLTLNPAANPSLWPVVLSLDLSQRVTVKRRSTSLATSGDYYVEQVNHAINGDTGEWQVTVQLSPVFVPSAWVLGDTTYGVLGTTTAPVY